MAYLHQRDPYAADGIADSRDDLANQLKLAAQQVDADPDDASLILDGLIWRIVAARYLANGKPAPHREHLLAHLDESDPVLAGRIRLALRAPDVRARLVHAQQLYALLLEADRESEEMLARLEAV